MKSLSPCARAVIVKLQEAGFGAYAVGGCVRDLLLGREPKDWDVATSARPEQVQALFPHTVGTGLQHGTVTVLIDHMPVEVTTFRRERKYSDCRRPDEVIFTERPEEDAARRDFTVNALYWDGSGAILDFFGGQQDLRNGRLCSVGKASARFSEDALRMLRAARFCAQLGFRPEPQILSAMRERANRLREISRERIGEELEQILLSDPTVGFPILVDTGCLTVVDPRLRRDPSAFTVCAALPPDAVPRWAALLWGCEECREVLHGLRRDRKTISRTAFLTAHDSCDLSPYHMKQLAAEESVEAVGQLAAVRELYGEGGLTAQFRQLQQQGQFVTLDTLAVTGRMLLDTHQYTGKEIGRVRKWLLDQVLLGNVENDIGKLTKKLKEMP